MEHVTTPETAQRLKDAGFPQPEFKTGQFWYLFGVNDPVLVIPNQDREKARRYDAEAIIDDLKGVYEESEIIRDEFKVYAPTATDILRELGGEYSLVSEGRYWFCKDVFKGKTEIHANPAEAAAMAWLDKHEKQHG